MYSHRYSINPSFTVNPSLFVHQCGWEDCNPGHAFGPSLRDHYLLHFVFRGQGTLSIGEKTYVIRAGQGFLIHPGVVNTYCADNDNPWYYGWMGFTGSDSARALAFCDISPECPVFTYRDIEQAERCILSIVEEYGEHGNSFLSIARMFELFSYMGSSSQVSKGRIVDQALDYIEKNYASGILVSDIVRHININRSQLFRIFKKATDISPQQYLLQFKLDKAASLLRTTHMSIAEVAAASGYANLCNFSRQFKEDYGYSPNEYRKRCSSNIAFRNGINSMDGISKDEASDPALPATPVQRKG